MRQQELGGWEDSHKESVEGTADILLISNIYIMMKAKVCQVGHKVARLIERVKGQRLEDTAKCIIAILDLLCIAIKLYFGVPIGYVDVFNAAQDIMSIVQYIKQVIQTIV